MHVHHRTRTIDGVQVFYREAGSPGDPALVLLHGFPTSSHMFRHLIPALASRFHVIAPDYPGFGQSEAPSPAVFSYTFDRLSEIVEKLLLEELALPRFTLLMQDYGGPVGFRIATRHPEMVEGLIVQNSNAYEEGFTGFWNHLREQYWRAPSPETEAPLRDILTAGALRWIYTEGVADPERISPDNWIVDHAALQKPEAERIQLDLFYDYRTNVALYPAWQAWLRTQRPPVLVVWGKNDPIFTPEGATAFRRDVPDAEVHFFDTGHFAMEEELSPIAAAIEEFHQRRIGRPAGVAALGSVGARP